MADLTFKRLDSPVAGESFDTKLSPAEEAAFPTWKQKYAPNDSGADYDLRGAYKAGLMPDPQTGHWPDTYKKPNHPTFSDQSMYATGANKAKAGHWEGEEYTPAESASLTFSRTAGPPQPGGLESIWEGVKNFGSGAARGLAGEGVPKGKASEDSGGRSEFGGRMVGAGARSVLDGLWDAITTPGKIAAGDKPFKPEDTRGTVEQALGPAMLMAGQGGRRPMVTPREAAPAAKPLLALPPPTVETAGRPAVSTGVGPREFEQAATQIMERGGGDRMLQSAQERLPQPGIIPPGPRGTMTSPAATPRAGQPIPAPAPAGTSVVDATTSPLSRAIVTNDGAAVDRQLTRTYRRAVKPGRISQPSASGLTTQDNRILTAVDQIIANRSNLKLTNEAGAEIPQQLPRSLRQFSEAIDQTKGNIFRAYDQQARAAGQAGAQVQLAPVVAKLREIARSPEVVDLHPSVAADAERFAQTMESRGAYSPSEAQDVVQNLNKTLLGFWRNPTHETVSRASLLAPVSEILRAQLDKAIDGAAGPGYQQLRNQYAALRSIEKDVASAVQREAGKQSGGLLSGGMNLLAGEEFLRGVFTMNPEAVGTAAALKAAQMGWRYINNPNRAIGRMFERRAVDQVRAPYSPGRSGFGQQPYNRPAGLAMGDAGGALQPEDRRGPTGGTIIGQRSIQRPVQGYPSQ